MRLLKILSATLVLTSTSIVAQTDSSTVKSTNDSLVSPTFSTSLEVLDDEAETQDVSGLLQSSKDVFTNIAGFNFSAARYRVRGYDSENFNVSMNGVTLNNPENGRAIWAFWGGLNDITRYQESQAGISASSYNFSAIGGFSNIEARATSLRKGSRISYALGNISYTHRVMATYATGMMSNGFAVAASVSKRWSDEGYVDGTFYNGGSYFLSLEKKINNKHSLGLVAYGAPTIQGKSSISTQETYDLTGNNHYNSYWGYQNGEKRNSRIRNNHEPEIILSHYFDLNDKTKITSSLYYTFGKEGNTRLNWYSAADPRPDYYKNLPSYYDNPSDVSTFELLTSLWQANDPSTTQLDFDQMYFANTKNLFTQTNVDGIAGNDVTGNRAKYVIEEERKDISHYGFNTVVSHKKNDHLMLTGGLTISKYKSNNYKLMNDLLGADFWVDVDQFAERDFADESAAQSDLNHPNHIIKQGDRFGYDYDININTYSGFGQIEVTSAKFDGYAGLTISNTSFWRTGNMKNGLFPENSLGDSEKQSFTNAGIKAGAVYKITGRHLIAVNTAYLTRAPQSRTAFISPKTRNQIIDDLKSETIMSGDLNYLVRYPKLKIRLTGFYTSVKDKTWARSLYFDNINTYGNYIMTGIDQLFVGTELGVEVKITSTIDATGAFTTGDYIFNSRPLATISRDNSAELLIKDRLVYYENYKIGGMPQTAASLGLKYNAPKFWFVGTNFNYFTDIYIEPSPDRRTAEALSIYVSSDPQVAKILEQTKLNDCYTINLFGGKSWRIKNKYYLRLNLNINNILDAKDNQTGGFEQLRYDAQNIDKFPPKIGYMLGRTYFGMVSFSF